MLYTREELRKQSFQDSAVTLQRYINKIHKRETRRFLLHECEYLSIRLRSIYQDEAATIRVLEPYDQPYLSDAVFKYLILVYMDNLDFLKPAFDGVKELSGIEIARDKAKFLQVLEGWKERLFARKSDKFIHHVKIEYLRKMKILEEQRNSGLYGHFRYLRKGLEQELNAFYIYFVVKTFFNEQKTTFIEFSAGGSRFVINIYSYVHIASRHYIPKLNGIDSERSFNNELPFIDPFNLPFGMQQLILDYFSFAPDDYDVIGEYMIFNCFGEYYILWWKLKNLEEISNITGYEIRTLYKIQSQTDRSKINFGNVVQKDEILSFYY